MKWAGRTYVPGGCAVEGLRCVVVAFAVAADEEEFVDCVFRGLLVQGVDEPVEALPLSQAGVGAGISWISLVDQTKVGGGLLAVRYVFELYYRRDYLRSRMCWRQSC